MQRAVYLSLIAIAVFGVALSVVFACQAQQARDGSLDGKPVEFKTIYDPLGCYSPDGTLYITSSNGLVAVSAWEADEPDIQLCEWPKEVEKGEGHLYTVGGLTMQFAGDVLVLGPDRDALEFNPRQSRPSSPERKGVFVFDRYSIPFIQLGLPSDIALPGSQLVVGDKVYTYEAVTDRVVCYIAGRRAYLSRILEASHYESFGESALGWSDLPPEAQRNVWLRELSSGEIVGIDQQSAGMYRFNEDLSLVAELESPEYFKKHPLSSRAAWFPGSSGMSVVYACFTRKGMGIMVCTFNSTGVVCSPVDLGINGNPWRTAVAMKSDSEGVLISQQAIYRFRLSPEASTKAE
jgi:hypothetical protein